MVSGIAVSVAVAVHLILKMIIFGMESLTLPSGTFPWLTGAVFFVTGCIILLNLRILPCERNKMRITHQILFEILITVPTVELIMVFLWNRIELYSYMLFDIIFRDTYLNFIYEFGGDGLFKALLFIEALAILYYTCIASHLHCIILYKLRISGWKGIMLPSVSQYQSKPYLNWQEEDADGSTGSDSDESCDVY